MTAHLFKKNGEITVFLALILSTVLGLLCVAFESARSQSIKFQDETAMDAALRSCFGEYSKELFRKYGLLYIDTSYKVGNAENINTEEHLRDYMQENLDFDTGENGSDYFGIEVSEVNINRYLLGTDDGSYPMYAQAVKVISEYGDISHTGRISAIGNELPCLDANSILPEWDAALLRVAAFGVFFINPAEMVRGPAAGGAQQAIAVRGGRNSALPYANVPSKRVLNAGNYGDMSHSLNDTTFYEYVYQKCGSYIHPKSDSVMSAELEYLLYAGRNDSDNTRNTVDRLIRIFARENLGYLSGDEGRIMEMKEYAEEIVPPVLNPEDPAEVAAREALVWAVVDTLKYAWAQTEAILKADRLLGGGNVRAGRSYTEWILPLRAITEYRELLGSSGGSGYNYEEFVVAMLRSLSREALCLRLWDLIEINVRNLGSPGFMADGSIEYLRVRADTGSSFGYEYNITRDYAYEEEYKDTEIY